jgi:hypothetical protein
VIAEQVEYRVRAFERSFDDRCEMAIYLPVFVDRVDHQQLGLPPMRRIAPPPLFRSGFPLVLADADPTAVGGNDHLAPARGFGKRVRFDALGQSLARRAYCWAIRRMVLMPRLTPLSAKRRLVSSKELSMAESMLISDDMDGVQ